MRAEKWARDPRSPQTCRRDAVQSLKLSAQAVLAPEPDEHCIREGSSPPVPPEHPAHGLMRSWVGAGRRPFLEQLWCWRLN